MAGPERKAKITLETSAAGMDRGIADARRKLRTMAREQATAAKVAEKAADKRNKRLAGAGNAVGMAVMASAGFDIAGGLQGMASDIFDTSRELTRFQIDAQLSSQQAAAFNEQLIQVSNSTGQSRHALLEMAHAYQILTGDASGAIANAQLFAEVANATGSSKEDIASVAAALHNMKLDPAQMRAAFDILVKQGHQGAVELRDLGGQLSSLQPMFAAFQNGSSIRGIAELGAAAQVMRKGFGSADEMATGFRGAMSQLLSPAVQKKLKSAGANILHTDPKTKKLVLNDWMDIVKSIKNSKVGNDPIGLRGIFTNIRAFRAIQQAVNGYDEMAKLANDAEGSNQVAKDNLTYMESTTGKLAVIWERIKNMVAEAFSPDRLEAFVTLLEKAGAAYNAIFSFGKQVRGFMDGGKAKQYSDEDRAMAASGYGEDMVLHGAMSQQEMLNRRAAAQRNMADVDAYNAAAQKIMDAQGAGNTSTPASQQAALEAKYSGGRAGGAALAGATYLRNSGFSDPAEVAQQGVASINKAAQQALFNGIANAVREGLAAANIVVKADSNAIAKTGSNAPINRQRQGRH